MTRSPPDVALKRQVSPAFPSHVGILHRVTQHVLCGMSPLGGELVFTLCPNADWWGCFAVNRRMDEWTTLAHIDLSSVTTSEAELATATDPGNRYGSHQSNTLQILLPDFSLKTTPFSNQQAYLNTCWFLQSLAPPQVSDCQVLLCKYTINTCNICFQCIAPPHSNDVCRTRNHKRKMDDVHEEEEGHAEFDQNALREHEEFTKVKNVERIELGRYEMETWYFSPLPPEYNMCKVCHVVILGTTPCLTWQSVNIAMQPEGHEMNMQWCNV